MKSLYRFNFYWMIHEYLSIIVLIILIWKNFCFFKNVLKKSLACRLLSRLEFSNFLKIFSPKWGNLNMVTSMFEKKIFNWYVLNKENFFDKSIVLSFRVISKKFRNPNFKLQYTLIMAIIREKQSLFLTYYNNAAP